MLEQNITTIILASTAVALITELTFLTRRPFTTKNLIIILFMTALVSPMLAKLFYMMHIFQYTRGYEFFRAASFTYGPFLYFYAKTETGLLNRITRHELLHFVPFIAAFIIMMISGPVDNGFHAPMDHRPPEFSHMNNPPDMPGPPMFHDDFPAHKPDKIPGEEPGRAPGRTPLVINTHSVLAIAVYLSMIIYSILIIRLIRKHISSISDYFSNDSIEISLKWITWITVCFLFSYLIVMADAIFYFGYGPGEPEILRLTPELATMFFIFVFSYFAFKQPAIYGLSGINNNTVSAENPEGKTEKRYEKSGLKDETAEKYYRQIIEFMTKEKPYTDPDLTINVLSDKLGIPRHHLTQVINEKGSRNFFMFINDYRISEAKEKISLDVLNEHSLLRIAYDAGFNSKSTFNTMFKKSTGMTPSEYRKTINIR